MVLQGTYKARIHDTVSIGMKVIKEDGIGKSGWPGYEMVLPVWKLQRQYHHNDITKSVK